VIVFFVKRSHPMSQTLSLDDVRAAVSGGAAAFRCRTFLQPAGGEGDKVFPPTYEGGKYATEKRRLPEYPEPIDCVLLDSVQSQANRMELALLDAWERTKDHPEAERRFPLPVITVAFPEDAGLQRVLRITSLEAPHRIADALLRDSLLNGKPFRKSDVGKRLDDVDNRNATVLFELCPTTLIFGMWDSTGPKGGLGAKFQRAMVSEIVGVNAKAGVKTSSRIDPAQIMLNAGPLFRRADGGWTLSPDNAMKKDGKLVLYKQSKGKDVLWDPVKDKDKIPDQGRPSTANHGNVTPTIDTRKDANNNTIYEDEPAAFLREDSPLVVYTGRRTPAYVGGVTIAKAVQMTVISLPALRRLRFPMNGKATPKGDDVARTALAALGLCAATLAREQGCDLRSRCQLVPTEPVVWELIDKPLKSGEKGTEYELSSDAAIKLLTGAVAAAKNAGLPWMDDELVLTPSPDLVALVKKSQELAAATGGAEEGGE
jgi:CRISPR-associated protein Csb1